MYYIDINKIAFSIFNFNIHWYALAYVFGLLIGMMIINKMDEKLQLNISKQHIENFLNLCVLGIITGGRIGHILFYDINYYIQNPIEMIKLWQGGMSFFGGFFGVFLVTAYYCKKNKIELFHLTDLITIAAPVGLFLGRIANFINAELLGRPTTTNFIFSVCFSNDYDINGDIIARHPSQLYEAFSEGFLLFIIMLCFTYFKKYQTGFLSGIFCTLYALFRFICEFFREPDSLLSAYMLNNFNITLNQIFCIPMAIFGIILIHHSYKSTKSTKENNHH